MPVSKKRKKNGKVVKNSAARRGRRLETTAAEQPSGVSLQDLINVLAYQEYVKDGTIVAPDTSIHIPETIPLTVGEGDDKRQVGTATPIPGDEEHLSINITDPEIQEKISGTGNYSIDEER